MSARHQPRAAALGGLLIPTLKTYLDRRQENLDLSHDLLEKLAACLWTYWKLAMRVAYYGSKGEAGPRRLPVGS